MMEERFFFEANGRRLAAVLHHPDGIPAGGVVCCHGLLADKHGPKQRFLAGEVCRRGYLALRFDFTGRGESGGDLLELTLRRQTEECLAALQLLEARATRVLGLFGSSYGGSTAICSAAEKAVAALVTLAAPARTRQLFRRSAGSAGLTRWRDQGHLDFDGVPVGYSLYREALNLEPLDLARRVSCPWLILHGRLDEVVPVEDALLLAEAGPAARMELIEQADHRLSDTAIMEQALLRAVDFLDRQMKGEPS